MEKEVIIVTGSCGRIGTQVVRKLGEKYHIVGFELLKALYAAPSEELVPVDLSSDESVAQAMQHIRHFYGNKIASVVHLAAYYSFDEQHSDLYDKITVQGTERLLKALQDFEVEQFIFSSTMLIYAPCKVGHPIVEESLIDPKWDYPLSKVKTEEIIHKMKGSMSSMIFRIAGVYDDHCHSIPISHQIQRIFENQLESRFYSGSVKHGSSFVHMEDLVEAIVLAVEKRKRLPSELALLIGEPRTLSYDELQRSIARNLGKKEFKTWRVPKLIAKMGAWMMGLIPFSPVPFIKPWMIDLADDHYEMDISRAEKYLGWTPKHNLQDTLPKMIAELEQNPQAWYKANQLSPKGAAVVRKIESPVRSAVLWLGIWLMVAPFTFGYDHRIDLFTGMFVVLLGLLRVSGWTLGLTGAWLQAAPLLFWAVHPAAYLNDTFVGVLLILLFIFSQKRNETGPSIPPGWNYNPSSWPQRVPVVLLGTIGWFISRYLAAYQLGYIDTIWDPIFPGGTLKVITSSISKSFPVSDAGLGAFAYTIEVLLALKGGERRWRTMPWMALLFGMLVVPLGIVSITLIVLQPWVVGAWCFLCLITAACMTIMIPFAIDEIVAVLQLLRRSKQPFWSVFCRGSECPGAKEDLAGASNAQKGVSTPWNLLLSTLLGALLMLLPWRLNLVGAQANIDHTVGAFAIVVSVIAMAEVVRKVRYCNLALGSFIIAFSGMDPIHLAIGGLLVLLSFRQGPIKNTYG